MVIENLYKHFLLHRSICIDSRKLQEGDMFFALKGDRFDGNQFANDVLIKGASAVIVDDRGLIQDERFIWVENVLETLQNLARYHRLQFKIPFLAITGSNGKTTTKELVTTVLSKKFMVHSTEGNLNNHIGIPLTLLKIKEGTQIAVIEMGANHQKEIESYCKYVLPTHGLITNCGKAHLEGFGGEEGVRKGKGELFDFLRKNDGSAFICWDYLYFHEMSIGIKDIVKYGSNEGELTGAAIDDGLFLKVSIKPPLIGEAIQTNLVGAYNLPNVLAACAIGRYFQVQDCEIKEAIQEYIPQNNRSQFIEKDGNKVILDYYNANPTSMKLAIESFANLQEDNKVLVLGGMAELGEESIREHQAIIDLIESYNWKHVVLVGGDFRNVRHYYSFYDNVNAAKEWYQTIKGKGLSILMKASRSIALENIFK